MNWKYSWYFSTLLFIVALGVSLNACVSQTTPVKTAEHGPTHLPMRAFHGQGSTDEAARVDLSHKTEATTLTLLFRMEPSLQSQPDNELITRTATTLAEHAAREATVTRTTAAAAEAVSYRALYDTEVYIAVLRQEIVLLEGGSLSSELEAFLTAKAVEEAHPKAVGL
ncbi:MAG: hypothetical protein EA428_13100 [Spirochaetaceae bacterium]|nr:MAG: hypothetical protein EA428_13100 [Spirochaetaceae bacterium]